MKLDPMLRTAAISECGTYRYRLTRTWDTDLPKLAVVMLNPSTADAMVDDPTIRKVIHLARTHGYGGIRVFNLRALRATDPRDLLTHPHPVGPQNTYYLASLADMDVLLAWGSNGIVGLQGASVAKLLRRNGCRLWCLGVNKDGQPKHPLYLRNDTKMVYFDEATIA